MFQFVFKTAPNRMVTLRLLALDKFLSSYWQSLTVHHPSFDQFQCKYRFQLDQHCHTVVPTTCWISWTRRRAEKIGRDHKKTLKR